MVNWRVVFLAWVYSRPSVFLRPAVITLSDKRLIHCSVADHKIRIWIGDKDRSEWSLSSFPLKSSSERTMISPAARTSLASQASIKKKCDLTWTSSLWITILCVFPVEGKCWRSGRIFPLVWSGVLRMLYDIIRSPHCRLWLNKNDPWYWVVVSFNLTPNLINNFVARLFTRS